MKKSELLAELSYWLRPKHELLHEYNEYILGDDNTHRIFIDRGSKILFVAHIDTVVSPKLVKHEGNKIWATGLDDRLGCMIAYKLAKELCCDLLITDFEERIETTAKYHECKEYNWIVEFDRRGNDVVTYQLDSDEFLSALKEFFKIGQGSYTDVCSLKTEACCFNIGLGHEYEHSENSYMDIDKFNSQIHKFRQFFEKYKSTKFVRSYDSWWKKEDVDDLKKTYDEYWSTGRYMVEYCEICGNPMWDDDTSTVIKDGMQLDVCEDCSVKYSEDSMLLS